MEFRDESYGARHWHVGIQQECYNRFIVHAINSLVLFSNAVEFNDVQSLMSICIELVTSWNLSE